MKHPIQYESDPGHVTAIFHKCEKSKKDKDLRNEPENGTGTGNNPVQYQILEPFGTIHGNKPCLDSIRNDFSEQFVIRPVRYKTAQ